MYKIFITDFKLSWYEGKFIKCHFSHLLFSEESPLGCLNLGYFLQCCFGSLAAGSKCAFPFPIPERSILLRSLKVALSGKSKSQNEEGRKKCIQQSGIQPIISSIVSRTYVELEGQMILRLSAVSASAAWPQITGIKSRASHHYQPSNYQPSNCTISLPTMYPFPYQPTKNSDWSICGQRAQWQQWRCFKAVLGQDEETCYAREKICEFGCSCPKRQLKSRHLFQANDSCKPVIS